MLHYILIKDFIIKLKKLLKILPDGTDYFRSKFINFPERMNVNPNEVTSLLHDGECFLNNILLIKFAGKWSCV